MKNNENYIEVNNNRNYIELNNKSTVKITPIRTGDGIIYKIKEVLYLDEMPIYIGFYTNRLGKAISKIKNSYFDFQDSPNLYNSVGAIQYKIYLLSRIKGSMIRKKNNQIAYEQVFSR